jgi:hypothetical protein
VCDCVSSTRDAIDSPKGFVVGLFLHHNTVEIDDGLQYETVWVEQIEMLTHTGYKTAKKNIYKQPSHPNRSSQMQSTSNFSSPLQTPLAEFLAATAALISVPSAAGPDAKT